MYISENVPRLFTIETVTGVASFEKIMIAMLSDKATTQFARILYLRPSIVSANTVDHSRASIAGKMRTLAISVYTRRAVIGSKFGMETSNFNDTKRKTSDKLPA